MDFEIADEQAEQLAFGIYNEIREFIEQNATEFLSWLFNIPIEILSNVIMVAVEGCVVRENYNYDICKYNFKEAV